MALSAFKGIGDGRTRFQFGLQVPEQHIDRRNVRHALTCATSVFNPREQPHEAGGGGHRMEPLVVVKLGGGLITDKANLTTCKPAVIQRLASELAEARRHGVSIVVVHGAGSYGHLRAKQWGLAHGRSDIVGDDGCTTQDEAVVRVREEMMELADAVCAALEAAGLILTRHPPHQWAEGTGANFSGDVLRLEPREHTPVTWGDVVPVRGKTEFGILSGDDIVHRCATELPNVVRVVFAMGGADGVLRRPPQTGEAHDLIEVWTHEEGFVGHHASEVDVTGGIALKVERALSIAAAGVETFFVNGEIPGRLLAAVLGQEVRGTRFPAAQKG